MLEAIKNHVYNLIPLAGTPKRAILDTSLSFALSYFSSFFYSDQGRTTATLATLGLKGRLSGPHSKPFAQWIKQTHSKDDVKQAKNTPVSLLINSQMPDLIRKMIAATAFYFTWDISFYASMTHLLSHSERVSKIAQPILDKVAFQVPYLLYATRVVVFAPIIVKLIHMTLTWTDPKGEYKALDLLKRGANGTAQALEVLWNLRFSLLCLGISTTLYRSVVSTVYSMLVKCLVPNKNIRLSLGFLPLLIKPSPDAVPSRWNSFRNMFGGYDFWPTTGFRWGLDQTWLSLQASSASYDTQVLVNLFNEANNLKGTVDNIKALQTSIEITESRISSALEKGKISPAHASTLRDLLEKKIFKTLSDVVLDDEFKNKIEMENFQQDFKAIYCQQLGVCETQIFIKLLKDINDPSTDIFDLMKMHSPPNKYLLSSIHQEAYKTILFKKFKQAFNTIIIPDLSANEFSSRLFNIHSFLSQFTNDDLEKVNAWCTEIFNEIVSQYPENLTLETLLDDRIEKNLVEVFRTNGIMQLFAVTPEDESKAYHLSNKFYLQRFKLCLEWYRANQPPTPKARKEIEYYLLFLALQVKPYTEESDSFNFLRKNLEIPEDFHFETKTLSKLKRPNGKQDRKMNAIFLDPWSDLVEDEFQSSEREGMTEMLEEKHQLYSLTLDSAFLSSKAIKEELLKIKRNELKYSSFKVKRPRTFNASRKAAPLTSR